MQLIHAFNISPREYYIRGKKNDFPGIETCPLCSYPSTLSRHGFYWRNVLFRKTQYRIPILRLKCPSCGKTISLLPDFLLPHFQYSLEYILGAVRQFFYAKQDHDILSTLTVLPAQVLGEPEPHGGFFPGSGIQGIYPGKR